MLHSNAAQKIAAILAGLALVLKRHHQAFNCVGDVSSRAAISDRPRHRRKLPERPTNAKVVGIH